MTSTQGATAHMDWRNITERLLDPHQRRAIVTKADTDAVQQMKTKNAFTKRKRKIFDQIRRSNAFNKSSDSKKSDDHSPTTSPRSSRCSELNFTTDEAPSTPPPTLPPGGGTLPLIPGGGSNNRHQRPHQSTAPTSASNDAGSDSESGVIDMGDYEHRIRPSSAFWRKKDGMSLAEKIIYYRNWKYRNPKREENRQKPAEMESTLTDHRRMRTTRHAAKSAATLRRRNSLEELDRQRPVTVIPKVTGIFPPIANKRHVVVTSPHDDAETERLPPIEKNQLVSRSNPSLRSDSNAREEEEEEEMREYGPANRSRGESVEETDLDAVDKDNGDEAGEKPDDTEEEPKEDTEEAADELPPPEEPQNPEDNAQDEKDAAKRKKRVRAPWLPNARPPRPNGQPDKLIRKLDKKVERDLRALQGQPTNAADDDDDDDTDVDDDTMNDILHGERGKQLDNFLRVS